MRVAVRPILAPEREIDVTGRLVAAIAEELWIHFGGNAELNWLEAERHLESLLARACATPPGTMIVLPVHARGRAVPPPQPFHPRQRIRRAAAAKGARTKGERQCPQSRPT